MNSKQLTSSSHSSLVNCRARASPASGGRALAPTRSGCACTLELLSPWDSNEKFLIDRNQLSAIVKSSEQVDKKKGITMMPILSRRRARQQQQQQRRQEEEKQMQHAQLNANDSFRYKNLLSARSFPIVFILVSFLIIANSRCDSVGSTNVIKETTTIESSQDKLKAAELAHLSGKDLELEALEQQVAQAKAKQQSLSQANVNKALAKLDPLSMLREIYLDHNSKVITLLPDSDTVQKFHPNGRYGRRSVDNYVEPHAELGKLIYDDQLDSARSLANNRVRPNGAATASSDSYALRTILRSIGRMAPPAATPPTGAHYSTSGGANPTAPAGNLFGSNGAQVANYQLEMNKLLKCNYTGISNLYWCDSTTAA